MAYYGRYGRGLDAFVNEWGLDRIGDKTFDPVVLEALQSVLDATSPERGYILSFVPTGTAATSFSSKRVVITSEALRGIGIVEPDRWSRNQKRALAWSNGRRFRISAGMVCHEVSHVRYGQDTAGAVDRVYKGHANLKLAQRISNILDDTRIEKAFAWDFPGFGDALFAHVLEWVARKSRKNEFNADVVDVVEDRNDALNAMLLASRYDVHYNWPMDGTGRTDRCRDFGKKWAKKYTRDDSVALHLAGVKAAIDFLRQFPKPLKPEPEPDGGCGPVGPKPPEQEPQPDDPEPADEMGDEDEGEDEGPTGSQSMSPDDFDDEDDEDEDEDDEHGGSSEDLDDEDYDEDAEDRDGDAGDDDEDDEDEGEEPEADETPAATDDNGEAVIEEPKDNVPDFDKTIESSGSAADKAMNRTRDEVAKTRETITSEETHGSTVKLNRRPTAKPTYQYVPKPDLGVAHEVRLAFESTRFSHDEWASGHATGRFRSRDAHRAASGDINVFSRRENESSTRVHLTLLIDYSGSMNGSEWEEAMRFSQTVSAAMEDSPVFRQSVWKYSHTGYSGTDVNLDLLWSTGHPKAIADALRDGGNPTGSTPTGEALYALGREMNDDRRGDEALLLLSITDGSPDKPAVVKYATEHWGERRVAVVGVRIGAASGEKIMNDMRSQYGDDRVIEFTGSWKDLAEDVGSIIGQTLAGTL